MGENTFISLVLIIVTEKNYPCKLQLFSQNTDVLHFPQDFQPRLSHFFCLSLIATRCTGNEVGRLLNIPKNYRQIE